MFSRPTYRPFRLLLGLMAMLLATGCAGHSLRAQPMAVASPAQVVAVGEDRESMLDTLERFFVFAEPVIPAAETTQSTKVDALDAVPESTPVPDDTQWASPQQAVPVVFRRTAPPDLEAMQRPQVEVDRVEHSMTGKSGQAAPMEAAPKVVEPSTVEPSATRPVSHPTPNPAPPVATVKTVRYTVVSGDTLRDIAQRHLGDANLWNVVWKANPDISDPSFLRIGQVLTIPAAEPERIPEVVPELFADVPVLHQGHLVMAGETLGHIARRYLGDASRWREIFDANPQLADPARIVVGQVLAIPGNALARRRDRHHAS